MGKMESQECGEKQAQPAQPDPEESRVSKEKQDMLASQDRREILVLRAHKEWLADLDWRETPEPLGLRVLLALQDTSDLREPSAPRPTGPAGLDIQDRWENQVVMERKGKMEPLDCQGSLGSPEQRVRQGPQGRGVPQVSAGAPARQVEGTPQRTRAWE
ncbi:hypothetical protein AAFF_G00028460 [Aldrovandia affinis]|uniref:Uncharacterized protein n=1 Tax=Aldrovandia affinis TaxID=143900 RepID=A0AAD7S4K5_9TELE|nr:hypothetical protein AAFF_G00028460 [Aldrovandia affinis]